MGSLFEQKGDKASLRLYMELYSFGSENTLEKETLARNISTVTITEVISLTLKGLKDFGNHSWFR